jgi:tetratricopeptide (TPR) repeat protein
MTNSDLWCWSRARNLWRATLWMFLGLALALASPAMAQKRKGFPETPSERGQALFDLRTGFQRLSAGDARGAIELLTRAIDSENLPDGPLGSAYFFRGAALREQGKFREALNDLDQATKLTPDKAQVPVLAFDIAMRMDKLPLAHQNALRIAKTFPNDTASLDLASIFRVVQYLDKVRNKDDAQNLRAALFDAGYHGGVHGAQADALYLPLVSGYLDRNDIVNAVRVTGFLTSVDSLLAMSIDKRYEEVWPTIATSSGANLQMALQKQIENYRAIVKESPDEVSAVHRLVEALRMANQSTEASKIATNTLDDPISLANDPDAYFWVLTKSAYADADSGNAAAGAQKMTEIMPYKLDDYPELVSHHINRGAYLLDQGDFVGASKAARTAESKFLSSYGRMWINAIDFCAAVGLKQKPETIQPFMDILKDNIRNNPSAYTMALLCADKKNDAEQFYLKRLSDPELRGDALQALQIYAKGQNEGTHFTMLQERLAQIRSKSSTRKAIDKVGRQLTFTMPRGTLGIY